MRFSRLQINNFYNLKDVDLDLSSGSALIVGPNGSGKSNIIKCVQGLVKLLLTRPRVRVGVQFSPGTWSVNENPDETFIKIRAVLSRKEAEILGCLHAIFITFDVMIVANMISELILPTRKDNECLDHVQWTADEFNSVIPSGASETLKNRVVDTHYNEVVNKNGFLTEERILRICIEELYPKLRKLAFDNQNMEVGVSSSDVELFAIPLPPMAGEHGDRRDFRTGLLLSEDVKLPGDVAAKKKVVIEALDKIFYDSDIEGFGLKATFEDTGKMSLVDAIGHLVEPKLLAQQFVLLSISSKYIDQALGRCYCVGSNDYCLRDIKDNMDLKHYNTFCRDIQSLLNDLDSTYQKNYSYRNLGNLLRKNEDLENLLRMFLKGSLCILPQDRGIFSETDGCQTVSLSAVESQLITWKLSEDELERQQFMKVKDSFKALSGLDIEAVQQHRENTLLEEQLIDECRSLPNELIQYKEKSIAREVGASAYEIGFQLKKKGDRLMTIAPRELRYVGLMATKTLEREGSTQFSIRTPLLDCSGGEKECLMVLTAIQMSSGDTVFLDEPGHSLHPPQQSQLRRFLETQRRQDQSIITVTHAVEFISTSSLKSLYHMSCTGMGFTPFKLAVHGEATALDEHPRTLPSPFPAQVPFDQSVMNMLMGPDMRKAFFATGLYFVEGETDKKVLNSLRYYMLEHARLIREDSSSLPDHIEALKILEMDSWDILALGGCGNAVKAYKAAKALKIPCAVILDEDTITVKHGKRLEPFTQTTWEKSNLYRELKANERSLSEASEILHKLKSAFEDSEQEEMRKNARLIFEEYGFWIWNGDLEGIIFDNKDARKHIKEVEEFMNVVLPNELARQLHVGSRALMPLEAALVNFDNKLRDPLEHLLDELQDELSASRDAKRDSEDSITPVTEKLQAVLENIGKFKQTAMNYDRFCKKGTNRKLDSGEPLKKKFAKSSEEDSSLVHTREEAFWKRVKEQLHDHGEWMKIPEEMMQKIVAACLKDGLESDNPLAQFCKFMKRHQYRGRPEKKHLPEDIISRILANATSS